MRDRRDNRGRGRYGARDRPLEMPMKITVNVDCTPEEARAFFGLPELKPLQDQIIQQMQERMASGIPAAPAFIVQPSSFRLARHLQMYNCSQSRCHSYLAVLTTHHSHLPTIALTRRPQKLTLSSHPFLQKPPTQPMCYTGLPARICSENSR